MGVSNESDRPMKRGVSVFTRSKTYRDNFDKIKWNKPKEECEGCLDKTEYAHHEWVGPSLRYENCKCRSVKNGE